jgi:hypothetical protein
MDDRSNGIEANKNKPSNETSLLIAIYNNKSYFVFKRFIISLEKIAIACTERK